MPIGVQLVLTYAGLCAVWLGMKFVHRVFKRLGNRTSMDDLIDRAEDGMDDAADRVAGYWKNRKTRKRKEEERPIVTIR